MANQFVFLLRQHVGAPCEPVVKVGDEVKVGTLLAKPTGLGANIHSSCDGKVASVDSNCIKVDVTNAGKPDGSFVKVTASTPLDLIKEAGVVGQGGAGFPTGVKLSTPIKDGHILINAAECEPFLAHNMKQIFTDLDKTIKGIKHCIEITGAKDAIIAIKKKHKEEILKLKEALKNEPNITLHYLPNIYPMGEERAVVRECLGNGETVLGVTELPSAANAHVVNIETALRIAEAIDEGKPDIFKNLTVAGKIKGHKNESQVFMNVPVGTPVKDIIEMAGGIDGDYGEIILGGPFTGKSCNLEDPITKTTGAILVTEPFENFNGAKTGLLVCACGGNEDRMKELAKKLNLTVGLVQYCKQAVDPKGNGAYKCENPGHCPGQAQKILAFKKEGCTDVLIGNCSDCTNTVMGSAPKFGMNVHHQTDTIFKTMGVEVMRELKENTHCTQDDDF